MDSAKFYPKLKELFLKRKQSGELQLLNRSYTTKK